MKYEKTLQRHPNIVNKKLLLVSKDKTKLFRDNERNHIEIVFSNTKEICVSKITKQITSKKIKYSLRKVGEEFLTLNDPSVESMLKYLVLPEMDVERIFNHLRYRYLKAIQISGFSNPSKLISSKYNKVFQALSGHTVYQGNTDNRIENDQFWINAGFSEHAKNNVTAIDLKEDLSFILAYIKNQKEKDIYRRYAELIAIKPGFHEIIVHEDYFNEKIKGNSVRSHVFRELRGRELTFTKNIVKMPPEINKGNFFSYGSCNVTEGPFVFRKSFSTSYFDEIRKIKTKEEIPQLCDSFYILPYHNKAEYQIGTRKKLDEVLDKAQKYLKFIT